MNVRQATPVAASDCAASTTYSGVEESTALSFIHEAVALAKALMSEGRRGELSPEQRHICYTDAVDALVQAVDVAKQSHAMCAEELEQLTRMLELAKKHAAA